MTTTPITQIRTVGKRGRDRKPPDGTQLTIVNPGVAPFAHIKLMLPGKVHWTDLGLVPVEGGVLELPLPLAFLCHAEEDQPSVAELGSRLEADGILTWFSPKQLAGGANWKAEIEAAIAAADFVVVFLSNRSANKKGYFQSEIKHAFELRQELPDGERFIIPALLEHCTPPARFNDIHWIRLYNPEGYEQLQAALRDLGVPTT